MLKYKFNDCQDYKYIADNTTPKQIHPYISTEKRMRILSKITDSATI